VQPAGVLHVTELVGIRPPEQLASFLADRGYLPKGVPFLKRVLVFSGQIACCTDRTITVDGVAMGERDLLEWKHTEPGGEGDDDRVCDASKIAISSALHILV
jgi:type IV secretory pathway protease TraF